MLIAELLHTSVYTRPTLRPLSLEACCSSQILAFDEYVARFNDGILPHLLESFNVNLQYKNQALFYVTRHSDFVVCSYVVALSPCNC